MPVPVKSNSLILNPEDANDFEKLFGEEAANNPSALNQEAPGEKVSGFGMATINEAGYGSWLDDEPLIQSSIVSIAPSLTKPHENNNVQLVH
jgi:hypothetical protein